MNPAIPMAYGEVGRWLWNFALAHAKREHPRIEAVVHMDGAREGRSYGLRLLLGPEAEPPASEPPIELEFQAVLEGRARFAWCQALAEQIRERARHLATRSHGDRRHAG
jgi:hypothetical protein